MSDEERDAIAAALQKISGRRKGKLTPDIVIEEAKDEKSPLHRHFTWDDSEAAHMYRVEQARHLIRSITVRTVIEETTIVAPYYVRDPRKKGREQGYVELTRLRSQRDLAIDAVIREVQYAASALQRARSVAQVLQIEEKVDALLAGLEALKGHTQELSSN